MTVHAPRAGVQESDTGHEQIVRALEICGDRWTLLIVHEIARGITRFGRLHRSLGISRTVLNKRLQHLVAEGIVERREYRADHGWSDYYLTARGRGLYPAIAALISFADEYLPQF